MKNIKAEIAAVADPGQTVFLEVDRYDQAAVDAMSDFARRSGIKICVLETKGVRHLSDADLAKMGLVRKDA